MVIGQALHLPAGTHIDNMPPYVKRLRWIIKWNLLKYFLNSEAQYSRGMLAGVLPGSGTLGGPWNNL